MDWVRMRRIRKRREEWSLSFFFFFFDSWWWHATLSSFYALSRQLERKREKGEWRECSLSHSTSHSSSTTEKEERGGRERGDSPYRGTNVDWRRKRRKRWVEWIMEWYPRGWWTHEEDTKEGVDRWDGWRKRRRRRGEETTARLCNMYTEGRDIYTQTTHMSSSYRTLSPTSPDLFFLPYLQGCSLNPILHPPQVQWLPEEISTTRGPDIETAN